MINYFARHPTAANLLMLALILLGLLTLPKLQRDTFPVIPAQEVEIRIPYPGSTPLDVANSICSRVEDSLDTVTHLLETRCDARENIAIVTAKMEEGSDMTAFFGEVKTQIDGIADFPDKVEHSSARIMDRVATLASIMVTGPMSHQDLKSYAEKIKTRIKRDRRIDQVSVLGFSDQDFEIQIPAEVQQRYGLGISTLRSAIEAQSLDLPSGVIRTEQGGLLVRFSDQSKTVGQLKDLVVVSGSDGGWIRLGEIAKIKRVFDTPEEKILFNGKRAAQLQIAKNVNQDSLRVVAALQEHLERERHNAPPGVELVLSQDSTANIRGRLRILVSNGAQGLVLVFLLMWLFFSFRFSFWVAMGLPVSFMGAIFFMHLFGYTLNMMTLVALLVAIGLLMDDAIVIAENISAKLRAGKNSLDAAIEGTKQVLPGVFSSFLTTIMIVGPLAFLTGKMGAVLKYIPAVLVVALAVSLIEAFLILPAHLRHSLNGVSESGRGRFHKRFDQWFQGVRDRGFVPMLSVMLRQPYLILGSIILLVVASVVTLPTGLLKYRAMPSLESDTIEARVLLPQGTPLRRTEDVVENLTDALENVNAEFSVLQKNDESLIRNVSVRFNTNIDAYESGPHLATVSADLIRAEHRVGEIQDILASWRKNTGDVADVVSLKFTDKERGVAGKAIDIRLLGTKPEMLQAAAASLKQWLSKFDGVLDLSDDLRPGKPEYVINLRDSAGTLGITAKHIADELRASIHGNTNLNVQLGSESVDVVIRRAAFDLKGIEDLHELPIRSPQGQLIPLSTVAHIETSKSYARLHRINGQLAITVQGTLDTRKANAKEIMNATKKKFLPEFKKEYPGVRVQFVGQGKESAATFSSLGMNLIIGLFGVYLILSMQFRDYVQPLAVMLSIPTAFIGVAAGHLAMGLDLSMPSLVGLATLIGVVVNDSILLVTFIRQRLEQGVDMVKSALDAARARFQAVILTSVTTVAGLTPLLLETSTQAQVLIPLVASLAFGLLAATLFSLVLVPVVFVIFGDLGISKQQADML